MFKFSDGGLSATEIIEYNDCTVRAFSILSEKEYSIVHKVLKDIGRKEKSRFGGFRKKVQEISKKLNFKLKHISRSGSLNKLIKNNPKERILVQVTGHVFAVINETITDTTNQSLHRQVKSAWKVI